MSRLRNLTLNALLLAGTVVVVLGAVEAGTRLLDRLAPGPARSWDEFRLRKPPPYRNASYDVPQLIGEIRKIKWRTSPDFGWLPEDQSGSYINIDNHERRTIPRTQRPRRIWMFGGSTIMGVEVPDAFTIPSFLQQALPEFEVRNAGATTISIVHQLYRLEHMTPVGPGDIVVFYDGVNDIIQSLYFRNPQGTMVDENRRAIESLPAAERLIFLLYNRLKDHSAFARRFLNPTKPVYYQIKIDDGMLSGLEEHYLSVLAKADAIARAKSATFVHFLQPTIYTVARQTDYEKKLAADRWINQANLQEAYEAGYPALRRAGQKAAAAGIASTDLSAALDKRQREIFLDFCHVTEHGNELVAASMLSSLRPMLSRGPDASPAAGIR